MKDFITIARFTYPSEYAVLKLLLDRNHINFIFLNETAINVMPFHSNAFGGIRLQVHQKDKEKAIQIIKEFNNNFKLELI
ncbi:MAG: DUF2007 domain-containing protein [Flavobacteriales bacterium]|nr:MAG: DUF2007 domain-containing protein [Flavobacteriales bacterium]